MKKPWYDDDAEVAKMIGVNELTGELVPYSYDDADWRVRLVATVLAIVGGVYVT